MTRWYARPLVFVRDVKVSLEFYTTRFGFTEAWRYEEEGALRVVQVDRHGCELILTEQWPEKAGQGVVFISPDIPRDEIRADLEGRGAEVTEGRWGYELAVVTDPDGNQLWFNEP